MTNNYWETNFPGAQPGTVTARYHILPYSGDFDESRTHKFAAEAEHSRPVVQHLGEPAAEQLLPATGTMLHLPQPPILTLNLRAESGCTILTLYNASDVAIIQSGLLLIVHAASCGLFGDEQDEIPVKDNSIQIEIAPRLVSVIQLHHAIDTA